MTTLFVASRSREPDNARWEPVGRLEHDQGIYRFSYTRGAQTLPGFSPLFGMDDWTAVYESDELFPIFKNRLLTERRAEYEAYLNWSGFDAVNPPDPVALLGVTEGIRTTDSIELFPCPTPDANGMFSNKFFMHGLRYMPDAAKERVAALREGEALFLMPDLCNTNDPYAVALRTDHDRFMVGYVPRYLGRDLTRLFSRCSPEHMHVFVDRVNIDAPLQQRLLCRMEACWPDGFTPCSDDAFQSLAATQRFELVEH